MTNDEDRDETPALNDNQAKDRAKNSKDTPDDDLGSDDDIVELTTIEARSTGSTISDRS